MVKTFQIQLMHVGGGRDPWSVLVTGSYPSLLPVLE